MSHVIHPLSLIASAPGTGQKSAQPGSWFEAMAEAWGQALDAKAGEIEDVSARLGAGDDRPATVTEISALSLQMGFLSNSAHTSMSSVGSALETMARKQ